MTKKFFLSVILALAVSFGASAQLFWKVSGNGLAKPSYLFGTHHLIEKDRIPSFDKVLAYVKQTDAVVGEMDMSDMALMQSKIMNQAMMKDTTLTQLLSADEYKMVDEAFTKNLGMGVERMVAMKPALLGVMYETVLFQKLNLMAKQPTPVDILFQNEAKAAGKKVIGLETIDKQINALLNTSPYKRQAQQLIEAVKKTESLSTLYARLNAAYLKGDLKALQQLADEEDSMNPQEKKALVTDRNNDWLGQLKKLMPVSSCFVAVGTLHLADETGLIAQLRKAGFKVEPVQL